ncbi:MAG: SDR family NAD(P)-dependent oxidoreductase, partial [Ilumatobacteraceae bacterium]
MAQVAVVTGGGGGIGLAIAARIVAMGGAVVIGDLNETRGNDAVAELGDRARFVRVDVAEESDVAEIVAAAVDSFGRLDVMFNNAGVGGAFGPIPAQPVGAWDPTIAV